MHTNKTPRDHAREMAAEAKRLETEAAAMVKQALRLRTAAGRIDGRFAPGSRFVPGTRSNGRG